MNSPACDIQQILLASDFPVEISSLFVGKEPQSPANCVTIYDTGGFVPELYDKPTIMIRVRNTDYADGYSLMHEIRDGLHELTEQIQGGTRYIAIWSMGDVQYLRHDENNRSIFTANFRIFRTPSTLNG